MFRITEVPSSGSFVQCLSTDAIEPFLLFLVKYCTRLPDYGSSVIRNMLEHF